MRLPRSLGWLFPEHRLHEIDTERDVRLVMARILEHGRMQDVRWCVRRYGLQRIHTFFREAAHPEISPRTIKLWRAALGAKRERWQRARRSQLSSVAPWPN